MKTEKNNNLQIATGKIDITPDYQVSLLGYFNDRRSEGVLDRLYCRLIALEMGEKKLLFVQIDTCLVTADDAEKLKQEIACSSSFDMDNILVTTSHTHTAPALTDFFGAKKEQRYCDELFDKIISGVRELPTFTPCSLQAGKIRTRGLSFNRRWVLDDGTVMTNPPKLYTRRVQPEGIVDPEVTAVSFYTDSSRLSAIIATVSNHTDTVGGRFISADWPGQAERYIQQTLGDEIILLPFIAPAGNINHFNFDAPGSQTGYDETKRIGHAYGSAVINALKNSAQIEIDTLGFINKWIHIPSRHVSDEELRRARALLKSSVSPTGESPWRDTSPRDRVSKITCSKLLKSPDIVTQSAGEKTKEPTGNKSYSNPEQQQDLTAEDLVSENPALQRLFAEELVQYAGCRPAQYDVPLQVVALGNIRICAIPGEPFAEMGAALKGAIAGHTVIPVSLANGYFGYIPPVECFERGGYEIRTTRYNCLSEGAFNMILDELRNMMNEY